jgi:phage shock protein E
MNHEKLRTFARISWLVLMAIFAASLSALENEALQSVENWNELEQLLEEHPEVLLIDVRTPAEYEAGHIPGARLIPHTQLLANPLEIPRDTPIVLYCRSGNRSGQAYRALERQGFTKMLDFGGIYRWQGELNYGPNP